MAWGPGRTHTLDVDCDDTIAAVKARVQERSGFPVECQRLMYEGRVLLDGRAVSYYHIPKEAILRVYPIRYDPDATRPLAIRAVTAFDRVEAAEPLLVDMKAGDTIASLKARIQEKWGFEVASQELIWSGTILPDDKSLSYCAVPNDAILYLRLRHALAGAAFPSNAPSASSTGSCVPALTPAHVDVAEIVAPVPPPSIDVCILLHETESLASAGWTDAARESAAHVVQQVRSKAPCARLRFGVVLYRDVVDDVPVRHICLTADVLTVQEVWANSLEAHGRFGVGVHAGASGPSLADASGPSLADLEGGIAAVNSLSWSADVKLLVHVADAPAHGYSAGPCFDAGYGARLRHEVRRLADAGISYHFFRCNASTDAMTADFAREYEAAKAASCRRMGSPAHATFTVHDLPRGGSVDTSSSATGSAAPPGTLASLSLPTSRAQPVCSDDRVTVVITQAGPRPRPVTLEVTRSTPMWAVKAAYCEKEGIVARTKLSAGGLELVSTVPASRREVEVGSYHRASSLDPGPLQLTATPVAASSLLLPMMDDFKLSDQMDDLSDHRRPAVLEAEAQEEAPCPGVDLPPAGLAAEVYGSMATECLTAEIDRYQTGMCPAAASEIFSWALCHAARSGNVQSVDRLLADPRVDPAAADNSAIREAARAGHLAVVERLLADPRADPSAADDEAVRTVARLGHAAIVQCLLADARVEPAARRGSTIRGAAKFGHLAVVDRLLAPSPSFGPERLRFHCDTALWMAAKYGHVAVVDRLLAHPPASAIDLGGDKALQIAAAAGRLDVIDRLLLDPRIDPSAGGDSAIRSAARSGHIDAVDRLLLDSRLGASAARAAFRSAVDYGHGSSIVFPALLRALLLPTETAEESLLSSIHGSWPHVNEGVQPSDIAAQAWSKNLPRNSSMKPLSVLVVFFTHFIPSFVLFCAFFAARRSQILCELP